MWRADEWDSSRFTLCTPCIWRGRISSRLCPSQSQDCTPHTTLQSQTVRLITFLLSSAAALSNCVYLHILILNFTWNMMLHTITSSTKKLSQLYDVKNLSHCIEHHPDPSCRWVSASEQRHQFKSFLLPQRESSSPFPWLTWIIRAC